MKPDTKNSAPQKIDIYAFTRQNGTLSGEFEIEALQRLMQASTHVPSSGEGRTPASTSVVWSAQGSMRSPAGMPDSERWFHLCAHASVWMICQRCLQPVLIDLAVERDFRFVTSEKEAVQQDLETEEDLLVLTPSFDLLALIEDELLLAMPIIASHQICEAPLTPALAETQEGVDASHPTSSETVLDAQQHPFAVLAALKAQKD